MKKLLLAVLAIMCLSGCSVVVPPGWEGIRVNNTGARRGVEDYPVQTGRVFFNPMFEDVYKYPTFKQNYIWEADEAISFNSSEGTSITGDVGAVFNVKPGMTPKLFTQYRRDIEALTDGVVRNEVRDALNRRAGEMKVMEIIGPSKAELLDQVKKDLNEGPLSPYVEFETISFVHAPKPAPEVMAAINQVIAAMNNAEAARQAVATAEANAKSAIATAEGNAQSVLIAARTQAEANRILNASLTANLIDWQKIQKWNGVQPQVVGGSGVGILIGK